MINVALTILSGENEDAKTEPARKFALAALKKYSGVELSEADYNSWLTQGKLPSGKFPIYSTQDVFSLKDVFAVKDIFGPTGGGPLGSGPVGGGNQSHEKHLQRHRRKSEPPIAA
jgi:hypothetical protein